MLFIGKLKFSIILLLEAENPQCLGLMEPFTLNEFISRIRQHHNTTAADLLSKVLCASSYSVELLINCARTLFWKEAIEKGLVNWKAKLGPRKLVSSENLYGLVAEFMPIVFADVDKDDKIGISRDDLVELHYKLEAGCGLRKKFAEMLMWSKPFDASRVLQLTFLSFCPDLCHRVSVYDFGF